MFNAKERNNPSTERWTNIKKPAFGGPSEKEDFNTSKRKTLGKYQRVIDRDADFEGGKFNHNYDPTWKAITRDRASRDANKKPFEPMYAKPTIATTDAVEEGKIIRFEDFVNENYEFEAKADPMEETPIEDEKVETGYEVDEEMLEELTTEFGDQITEMIDAICEKMEIEKEEVCELLCAAIEKMCKPEEEEEGEDGEE